MTDLTIRLSPKTLAMVLARAEYQLRYMTKSKKDEEEFVKEHWRTFHYQAKAIRRYLRSEYPDDA